MLTSPWHSNPTQATFTKSIWPLMPTKTFVLPSNQPWMGQLYVFFDSRIIDAEYINTYQTIEISTGPPIYTRPSFPEHVATSPVLLTELLPNDLKNMFDSDLEED
jgi:hypothetical protein